MQAPDTARLVLLKLAVSLVVVASGFQGISDDDFARIVIAQEWAHAPALDPSKTSWLPLPFYWTGAAMSMFGGTVAVARAVAVLLGALSIALVHRSALWLTRDRASAFAGAAIAAVLPWSARLGASAVPELVTAACSLVALASLAPKSDARRILAGGALLFVACLSRYEPWFVAVGFSAFVVHDRLRPGKRPHIDAGWSARALAVALALLGPILWCAWNAHAHGAPLHFLDRVAAYKQAVDDGALVTRALAYILATFRAEPELVLVLAFVVYLLTRKADGRAALTRSLRSFRRPALVVLFLFVTLTLSSLRGGAPTHHPERALFVLHLGLALVLGHVAVLAARRRAFSPRARLVWFAVVLVPSVTLLRAWVLYRESFAQRPDELAMGADVATTVPPDDRVLLDTVDYGHFAIQAGSGRPWQIELAQDVRPGVVSEALAPEELLRRARERGIGWAVGTTPETPPTGARIVALRGAYALYRIEAAE